MCVFVLVRVLRADPFARQNLRDFGVGATRGLSSVWVRLGMGWVSVGGLGGAMCAGWCGGTLSHMFAVVVLFSVSVRVFAGV